MNRGEEERTAGLRAAFAALADDPPAGEPADPERVLRAVRGELSAAETAELVERAATDPATAEAWRLALALEGSSAAAVVTPMPRRRWPWLVGLAAAASLLVAVGLPLLRTQLRPQAPFLRGGEQPAVTSRLGDRQALPRERFLLRWSAAPAGSLYDVVVSDGDLNVRFRGRQLETPELLVPAAALERLAPGAEVLWRVEVLAPDGSRNSSETFVQRLR
jgi:hypothetical protein